jgi:hypothetical protein
MTTTISTHDTAAKYAAEQTTFWTGRSGEQVTGEQAARHIDATLALLERDGWVRNYRTDDPDIEIPDETASVKTMIRQLFRVLRDVVGADRRCTLSVAVYNVASGDNGDDDTWVVAERVLDVIMRARTGSTTACSSTWASKLGRTWEEVSELLVEAAKFARTYGPTT